MEIASRTATAMMNRIAANETGGRSRRPNLMASQVELQMRQSVTNAAIAAILGRCSGIDQQRITSHALQLLSWTMVSRWLALEWRRRASRKSSVEHPAHNET